MVSMGLLAFVCMIFMPTPLISRPHPAIWRLVTGLSLCYLVTITFILFLSRDELMTFLKEVIDPKLGVPLPERSYAEHCEVYTPDHPESSFFYIYDSLDMYIWAHFLGWFFKMMIIRDWKMCMFLQLGFEFMELTFRHWLPNFYECWWDSLILDIILCNTGGIIIAHYFMKLFKMRVTRTN